jgi:hypothetical protein
MRLRIPGYSKVLCYTFRGTGKEALKQVSEIIRPVLIDWLKAAGKTGKHVFPETDPVFQMRLTDQGCLAKKDIAEGNLKTFIEYVRKQGFFQFRGEAGSSAAVESLEIKDIVADSSAVAIATANASIGEIKVDNKIEVNNSGLAETLRSAVSRFTI